MRAQQGVAAVIHLIHGIHTSDKDNVTAKLAPAFRQVHGAENVLVRKYGYALALTTGLTNFLNKRRAERLAKLIKPGDSIVAHSNGCAIAWLIDSEYVEHLDSVILIQPALDSWRTFENTSRVLVLYNDEDEVVGASTLGFCSAWGDMGKVGYTGALGNVEQWDTKAPPHGLPPYAGHSGIVESDAHRQQWGMAPANWMLNKEKQNG